MPQKVYRVRKDTRGDAAASAGRIQQLEKENEALRIKIKRLEKQVRELENLLQDEDYEIEEIDDEEDDSEDYEEED